jgi:hypothetical protein
MRGFALRLSEFSYLSTLNFFLKETVRPSSIEGKIKLGHVVEEDP